MYHLYGADHCVKLVYRLAKVHNAEWNPISFVDLRSTYLDFLDAWQKRSIINRNDRIFIDDDGTELALANSFAQSTLNDLNQEHVVGESYDGEEKSRKIRFAEDSLAKLLSQDDSFALIFGLVIHSIFIRSYKTAPGIRASHGGSSSASIGAIWLAVNDGVNERDMMEMFVHELSHHLLFIDELSHPQFNYDEITKKENFTTSAILKRTRPLDKVVHSIVVSSDLILARVKKFGWHDALCFHPSTTDMCKSTLAATSELISKPNVSDLMSSHMLAVVDDCRRAIQEIDIELDPVA